MQAWEEKYYAKEEGFEEGVKDAMINLIQKKLQKGKEIATIADELETDVDAILALIQEMNEMEEE